MANKVFRSSYSHQQLTISGSFALLILVIPLLIVTYLLHQFASYQWLIDILLLWIIIQITDDIDTVNKANKALQVKHKQLAKDLLQQKLLRSTQSLSSLGLIKASLETLYLRYHHQQFTTILCYLILGPVAALAYRLSYEAHQIWNVKQVKFSYFGRLSNIVTQVIQLMPCLIMSISFVFISTPKELISHLKQKNWYTGLLQTMSLNSNQSILLQSLTSALGVNTGGPVMYDNQKIKRVRFTAKSMANNDKNDHKNGTEPTIDSVKTLINLINRHLIVSLLLITWIMFWLFAN